MSEEISLKDLFFPDLVFFCPDLKSKEEVFNFVAERLASKGLINQSEVSDLVSRLKMREEMGSTGIGDGVAIPHCYGESLKEIVGCLVRCDKGIDWGSIDGKPVRLILFLLAPEARKEEYLHSLAEVARVLSLPNRLKLLLQERDPNEVYRLFTGLPKKGLLTRYFRLVAFGFALVLFFILAKLLFSHIRLPLLPPYQEFSHFNEDFWINREILVTTLFFSMVLGTLLFFQYRVAISSLALSLILLFGVADIEMVVRFMSIPTILFIVAVMVIVRWLEEKGVFKSLVFYGLRYFGHSPLFFFFALLFFSALLAGLVDEVSAILITFGLAIEISKRTRVGIMPYLLGLVMATNIGSALTMIGNPIGIYLGFAGKLTFLDFLKNATPIAIGTVVGIILIVTLFYRKEIKSAQRVEAKELERVLSLNNHPLRLSLFLFLFFIGAVVSHSFLENLFGVEERTVLLAAPLLIVGFIIFTEKEHGRYLVERGPDWWTILYFMFLFACAACLEYTGVTVKIAYLLSKLANFLPLSFMGELRESAGVLTLLLWGSGLFSGFVDNLPIVAALVPVVKSLIGAGMPESSLFWWALLFGGCFGGNLTMIGSTANLVAIGVYERNYRRRFIFRSWLKIGLLVTILSLTFANLLLLLKMRFSF